jgi:thiol-disulfide isomerase/thioredoxin
VQSNDACQAFVAIDQSGAELMTGAAERIPNASLRLWVAVIAALVILDATGRSWVVRAAPALNPFDVEMRDASGRRLRLTDFKGRVVLVDLWASWCAECQRSFPVLDRLSREYRPRGVEIVAVNLDQHKKDAAAFLATRPHEMLVVFDPRARMLEAFGAAGIPSSYLIDRQGTVRYRHTGYTAGAEAQYRQQLDFLLAEPPR